MFRLDLPGAYDRRITLEASQSSSDGQAVYHLLDKALNQKNLSLDTVNITKAKFQIKLAPQNGKKAKSLTFEISLPDRCTLKDDPADQIAKNYVEQWGLMSG